MFLKTIFKSTKQTLCSYNFIQQRKCSVFRLKELIQQDKAENFTTQLIKKEDHEMALDVIKAHYLGDHVLVRARNMDLNDRALDEYIVSLMKQGNAMFATAEDGTVAGICVNYACSPVDPGNLRNYAYYRQNTDTKDFLYFTAKLQETPNLWEVFKEPKIFEIKMLAVLPQYRRQGLATMLTEKSKEQAFSQGYKVIRMDCINSYDYKVAERCLFQCIVKFPLHRLRGANAPYIKKSSEHNRVVRVYVDARTLGDAPDVTTVKHRQEELESLIE